jgi:hypothetical protein
MIYMKVCSFAKKVSKGVSEHELEYLSSFFFDEFLGCGMPQEQCHTRALAQTAAMLAPLSSFAPSLLFEIPNATRNQADNN